LKGRLNETVQALSEARGTLQAEQVAATAAARELEAMNKQADKLQARIEQLEKHAMQGTQELNAARIQVQAQQAALDSAAREIEAAKRQADEARAQAKKAGEEAAELRGAIAAKKS
jgi:hypothetical protein